MSEAAILVTCVGAARGARTAATALVCAASEPDRAALLIDLDRDRPPRPSLIASAAARRLEERLAAHLPAATVAARGRACHLTPSSGSDELEQVVAALATVRDSLGVVHLPPRSLQPLLADPRVDPIGVLLRADLDASRPLTALAVRDLIDRDVPVAVLKRPLGWIAGRLVKMGAAPATGTGLDQGAPRRLLAIAGGAPPRADRSAS